jgi:hypothetical protein
VLARVQGCAARRSVASVRASSGVAPPPTDVHRPVTREHEGKSLFQEELDRVVEGYNSQPLERTIRVTSDQVEVLHPRRQ